VASPLSQGSPISPALRAPSEPTSLPDLSTSYALLTGPSSLVYGVRCGAFALIDPPGDHAIRELREAGRWDLVRSVLRGPNAGGRLYAATALVEAAGGIVGLDDLDDLEQQNALSPDDARALRALARDTTPVATCSACSSSTSSAADVLRVEPTWPPRRLTSRRLAPAPSPALPSRAPEW